MPTVAFQPEGTIITFYSFKGGSGRTMALANLLYYLADQLVGDRAILAIDWDLEAPGLHRYFLNDSFPSGREPKGLIDYFIDLRTRLENDPSLYRLLADPGDLSVKRDRPAWRCLEDAQPIGGYCVEVSAPRRNGGSSRAYLMRAGRFDANYAETVGSFPWIDFYKKYPAAFQAFRDLLAANYAFTLIDSRTGLTDTSGICTMIMPSKLVAVFTPNAQSLDGLVDLLKRSLAYRGHSDDFRPLSIFPLPSRIENVQSLQEKWRGRYQAAFEGLLGLGESGEGDLTQYFNDVLLPHKSDYAFGERIAISEEKFSESGSLRRAYEVFFGRLLGQEVAWELTEPEKIGSGFALANGQSLKRGALADFPVRVFIVYSHEDTNYVEGLRRSLSDLVSRGIASIQGVHGFGVDLERPEVTEKQLESSDLILVLVSAELFAWDYTVKIELPRIRRRQTEGKARVVPVIVRRSAWQETVLGGLQPVPRSANPLADYRDPDAFWYDVRRDLVDLIDETVRKRKRPWSPG